MTDDTGLIYLGGDCKALGSGRVGGYLVRYSTADAPDCQGDFFDAATFFGSHIPGRVDAYYHHGMKRAGDPFAAELGNDPIGVAEVKALADGLYAETTLDVSRPTVARLYAEMERGSYLGYSSGSDSRLIKGESVKAGVRRLARWPINDVTLSPIPVDRRNRALPIKSLLDDAEAVAAPSLVDRAEALVADAEEVVALFDRAARAREAEGRHLSATKREAVKALGVALTSLLDATAPRPDRDTLARLRAKLAVAEMY